MGGGRGLNHMLCQGAHVLSQAGAFVVILLLGQVESWACVASAVVCLTGINFWGFRVPPRVPSAISCGRRWCSSMMRTTTSGSCASTKRTCVVAFVIRPFSFPQPRRLRLVIACDRRVFQVYGGFIRSGPGEILILFVRGLAGSQHVAVCCSPLVERRLDLVSHCNRG